MARTNRILVTLAFAIAFPAAAFANPADDGNQGLAALQQGDNDTAIAMFTRALGSRQLTGDDLEFAYANRGKAYLNKGNYSLAVADLDRARQMKPDDSDAQNDLLTALQAEIPPDSISGRPKPSFMDEFGQALLQGLVLGIAQGIEQRNH
jgi:tetratricopeptide (TPR) repeat protein